MEQKKCIRCKIKIADNFFGCNSCKFYLCLNCVCPSLNINFNFNLQEILSDIFEDMIKNMIKNFFALFGFEGI